MANIVTDEALHEDCCNDQNKEWLATDALKSIDGLPDFGFRLRFDHVFTESCKPFTTPRLHQLPSLIGIAYRLVLSPVMSCQLPQSSVLTTIRRYDSHMFSSTRLIARSQSSDDDTKISNKVELVI